MNNMKHSYYVDFEFLEGKQDKTFLGFKYGETKHLIDMISIGIVSDDGREYYAICKEFNLKEAWNRFQIKTDDYGVEQKVYWLRENVLEPIHFELFKTFLKDGGDCRILQGKGAYESLKYLLNKYGKSSRQIAEEVYKFVYPEYNPDEKYKGAIHLFNNNFVKDYWVKDTYLHPQFYGYFSAYDWVCLCQLYGKMINLPEGFPWYCNDLKQELDSYISKTWEDVKDSSWGHEGIILSKLKNHKDYPVKVGAHNALADARWNKQLHEFLKNIACGK